MKEKWRLLTTNANNAFVNMAIDNALLVSNSEKKTPPTVRFYTWKPPAISIGYFQSLEDEVDVEKCEENKVDVVRRLTGGGAVFHEKELTYSIVIPESHPMIPESILSSYKKICGALIKGLRNLGIKSRYRPINDIVVNNRKISGNAQTRKKQTVLQHGTILIDVNVEKMFSLLKIPAEKRSDKIISEVKNSVTSISQVLNKTVSLNDIQNAMKKGFEEEFNVKLIKESLTDYEQKLAKKFEKEFFTLKEWNYKR